MFKILNQRKKFVGIVKTLYGQLALVWELDALPEIVSECQIAKVILVRNFNMKLNQ